MWKCGVVKMCLGIVCFWPFQEEKWKRYLWKCLSGYIAIRLLVLFCSAFSILDTAVGGKWAGLDFFLENKIEVGWEGGEDYPFVLLYVCYMLSHVLPSLTLLTGWRINIAVETEGDCLVDFLHTISGLLTPLSLYRWFDLTYDVFF
jgi:hypothetical protein